MASFPITKKKKNKKNKKKGDGSKVAEQELARSVQAALFSSCSSSAGGTKETTTTTTAMQGEQPPLSAECLYFYGHGHHQEYGAFSQFYQPCHFEEDGVEYCCAEQYMVRHSLLLLDLVWFDDASFFVVLFNCSHQAHI